MSILLTMAILLTMTACSSGSTESTTTDPSSQALETSFMASGEEEDATQIVEPVQAVEPEVESESLSVNEKGIPVIVDGDLGSDFEFGYNEEGFILIYPNSGNEYQLAWYNDDTEIETAFHDVYGCHYIFINSEERKTKAFYYTTDNGSLGNSIRYVNLETQEDQFITQGILYETLEYGYFNGRLVVWINGVNVKKGLEQGYYIYEKDGTMLTYVGVDYDQNFIKTGERAKEEPPAPETQPEAQTPVEPEPQPEPEKPVDPEPEPVNPIVVGESDILLMNQQYQFDLSGNGELDTFEFIQEEGSSIKFVVNNLERYFLNLTTELTSNEYRIIDLNPSDSYKDLEILEAYPPDEQAIHYIRVKGSPLNTRIEYYGPLIVAFEAYDNDRVLYQGSDQVMVIEMSKVVTAFYQSFYQLEHESIRKTSRPDICKYMTPLRVTMTKDMWVFTDAKISEDTKFYLHAGDEIIIHGEQDGNLWIEYLGECSSDFYWMMGTMIDHFPDSNGLYQFIGVQFWS